MGEEIIVVVQEPVLRRTLEDNLRKWGHSPLAGSGPEDAGRYLEEHRPALAILDNRVEGFDALDLLRRIRRRFGDIEVIYLVGQANLERGAKALELGASDFLLKPISDNRLGIALKRAQERRALRRKLAFVTGGEDTPAGQAEHRQADDGHAPCQSRLYDTLRKYQQLFDEVPCYISVLDQNFEITAINRRYKEELGDHIGSTCFDVYQGRCEGCPECPVAETFADGQSHQYEQVVTSLDGEQFNVLTWTAPLHDFEGNITQVMEISTNITQIRKLQDHLASLGMVIGSISHGVKGLLTALDGGMYSLRSGFAKNDPERIKRGWEVVELMVGRIRRTVLDVLYYAKEREVDFERVSVADFARQVAFAGEQAASKHPLSFEFHHEDDLGEFEVDPNALNPALINLLENAVDACLEDPGKQDHKIIFSVSREDDVIVFNIEDNGLGVDEATKENMFTLFFTSKGSSGTGLGLFIANDTVGQHGGTITVDSEPGVGSHFHVRIPARPHARLASEGPGGDPRSGLPGYGMIKRAQTR